MIQKIQIITTSNTDPYENLALEEYLMDTVEPGTCILYLWQNRQTVVIGQNQNAWQECKVKELEEDGGFLARRLSGGGAVFHDLGNLNFTFLLPRSEYDVARQSDVIVQAVRSFGLAAERSGRNDILVDGRKFSGNAYFKRGANAYHHGTLLIHVDMANLSRYLNVPADKLRSKGVRSVVSRVANLQEFNPDSTVDAMKERLVWAMGQVYGTQPQPVDEQKLDRARIQALAQRNASWEWRLGRKLPFDTSFSARFPWGGVTVQLSVESGLVHRAQVYSDAMDSAFIQALPQALEGHRFSARELAQAVEPLLPEAGQQELGFEADRAMAQDVQALIARQDF